MSESQGVRKEVRKFVETTTIRGIPKIIKAKDIILKIIWLISVLLSTSILCWQLSLLFLKYVSYPVATTYGEDGRGSIIFPDISICSLYPLTLSSKALLKYDDYYNFIYDNFYNDSALFDEFSSLNYYFANLPKTGATDLPCPKLITDCALFNQNWVKSTVDCFQFVNKYWDANYYTCFTLRLDDTMAIDTSGASFLIYFDDNYSKLLHYSLDITDSKSRGVRASVHPRGTLPDFKRGLNAGVGTETKVKITQTTRSRLSKPYSAYDCTNQEFMPNSTTESYDYEACYEVCSQQFFTKNCDCLWIYSRFSSYQINNFDICGNQSCILENKSLKCNYNLINYTCAFFMDFDEVNDYCQNLCLPSCKEIIYDTESFVSSWPHPSYELHIYDKYIKSCKDTDIKDRFVVYEEALRKFLETNDHNESIKLLKKQTLIKESFLQLNFIIEKSKPFVLIDKPVYTWDSMIGLVGGCLSLWLGITVMTGVEFIEFIYFIVTLCCRKKKKVPTATLR